MKLILCALITCTLILIICTFYLTFYNNELTNELDNVNNEYYSLFSEHSQLESGYSRLETDYLHLGSNYSQLETEYKQQEEHNREISERVETLELTIDELSTEKAQLNKSLSNIAESINTVKEEVMDFEQKVQTTLEWIKANSDLGNTELLELKNDLAKECLIQNDNYCEIRSHCIYWANAFEGYSHQLEYIAESEDEEYLIDLESMYHASGGDCEDWGLLFKSEYNYLKGQCNNLGHFDDKVKLVYGIKTDNDDDYCDLFKENNLWELPNCREEYVNDKPYASIVCYTISNELSHCVVAFTEKEIKNSSMVYNELSNALFIEPQGGFLVDEEFRVFNDSSMIEELQVNTIYYVITDNDFNLFYWVNSDTWKGYQDFNNDLSNNIYDLEELDLMVKGLIIND